MPNINPSKLVTLPPEEVTTTGVYAPLLPAFCTDAITTTASVLWTILVAASQSKVTDDITSTFDKSLTENEFYESLEENVPGSAAWLQNLLRLHSDAKGYKPFGPGVHRRGYLQPKRHDR